MALTNSEKQLAYRNRQKNRNREAIKICKDMLAQFDDGFDRMNTSGLIRIIELLERS